jgi:hypothetical protein
VTDRDSEFKGCRGWNFATHDIPRFSLYVIILGHLRPWPFSHAIILAGWRTLASRTTTTDGPWWIPHRGSRATGAGTILLKATVWWEARGSDWIPDGPVGLATVVASTNDITRYQRKRQAGAKILWAIQDHGKSGQHRVQVAAASRGQNSWRVSCRSPQEVLRRATRGIRHLATNQACPELAVVLKSRLARGRHELLVSWKGQATVSTT